jgi:metallo-beta-lactamase family protein
MHLEFFGAAGEVTGSCHIVRVGRRTLLLDCGMIQGGDSPDERNRQPFPFEAARVDAVILSHAHIDHCGRLPLLCRRGFRGPIHATAACRDLAQILLADSASMAERDAERVSRKPAATGSRRRAEPLYTVVDAAEAVRRFVVQPYDRSIEVLPGVRVTFRDAGHILGSASVVLELEEEGRRWRVLFSGDVGQYDSPILRDPATHDAVDVVLMESTYGNRRHRDRTQTLEELGAILLGARRDGGNVLMPAFAVGRSQDILYEFATHFDAWRLGDWRIFLDSPMAIEASKVYWSHPDLYDADATAARQRIKTMPSIPNLELTRTAEQSMKINEIRSGAIVIAGSGMCTGGRIVHHLKHNLGRSECAVVFTGFQAEGTPGRAIVDRRATVRIHGTPYQVAARVHTLGGFSAHGDQQDLLRWYSGLAGRPDVWLVHGEHEGADGLQAALTERGVRAQIARPGLRIEPPAVAA